MAAVNAFKVRAIIEAGYDKTSLARANKDIQQSYSQLAVKLKQVTNASRITQTTAAGVGASLVAAFAGGIAAAAAFEEQFVNVKKTLNVAGDAKQAEAAFDNISKRLREMVKLAPITTDAINEIAAIGGQLGVAASEIVSFTDTIQKLTIATNLSADQAALSMARLQEITGTAGSELDNLGSSLVALGNNFAATESEIVTAALQIATATAQIGGEMNQTAVDALAFSTTLKAIGQPSQAGATAIVRLMTELSEAIALGGKNLEIFAQTAGMSVDSFKSLFEIDSTKAVALFIDGLNDVEKTGKTNIGVLQELGLGQVRTQKAILATAKASDTLFEAIEVANAAFMENNALNEEAERRYETLVSEIIKGKNVLKGEVLDFGLDNIDKGTNAIRQLNNALLTIVQGLRVMLQNSMVTFSAIAGGVVAIKAFSTNLAVAREAMGLYAASAIRAARANEFFNTSVMRPMQSTVVDGKQVQGTGLTPSFFPRRFGASYGNLFERADLSENLASPEFQQELFSGGFFDRGLLGNRNPLKKGAASRELRKAIVDNPAFLETIYGGQVPDSLKFMLAGQGMTKFGSGYLQGVDVSGSKFLKRRMQFGAGRDVTSMRGRVGARVDLFRQQKELEKLLAGASGAEKGTLQRAQQANLARQRALGDIGRTLRPFGSGGRTRGMDTVRRELSKLQDIAPDTRALLSDKGFDKLGFMGKRQLEKQIPFIAQGSKAFAGSMETAVAALEQGDLAGGKLALAMEDVNTRSGRVTNTLKGIGTGMLKLGAIGLAVTAVFKVFEKMGEQSRGVMQFTQSMREMDQATQELTSNTEKLAKAQQLLEENRKDAGIVDLLEQEIEDLEQSLSQQEIGIRRDIGESFMDNIMTGSFGKTKGGIASGTAIERLVEFGGLFAGDQQGLRDRFAESIGTALMNVADSPDLPNVNTLIESLLFEEGGFGQENIVPSGFFRGTSAQIIEQLLADSGVLTGEEFLRLLGIDGEEIEFNNFEEITTDILGTIQDFIHGAATAEDVLDDGFLKPVSDRLKVLTKGMNLTNDELAQMVIDTSGFIMSIQGLTGETTRELTDGLKQLDESSPVAQSVKRFIKARVEDFVAAGVITRKELNDAGNDYQKLFSLFQNAQQKFIDENKVTMQTVMDEFGVTEQAALRLAMRMEEAFNKAREAMVNLTQPLPDNQFDDTSLLDLIINAQNKARAQEDFEEAIKILRQRTPFLADILANMGVMGGGLELASRYLANPELAIAQEQASRTLAGPSVLQDIFGTSDPLMAEGEQLGTDIVDGITKAFTNKEGEVVIAFTDMMKLVVDETAEYIKSKSPSMLFYHRIGVPMIDGVIAGIKSKPKALQNALIEEITTALKGMGASEDQIKQALQDLGAADIEKFTEELNKSIFTRTGTALQNISQAFGMVTAITKQERSNVQNQFNLNRAKFDYIQFLKTEQSLQNELSEVSRKRIKMEVDGQAGVITLTEKAGLLRQEIAIEDRKRRLRGDFTAQEQLGINEQTRKVSEYQRMFDLGVIGALDLEAEQDKLRNMTGGFKTDKEKELFFIESALAEEQLRESERVALLEDSQLQELRAAEDNLIFQIENFATQKEIQYGKIEAAEEAVTSGIIALTIAQETYKASAPDFIKELGILDTTFGGVNKSVRKVLDATNAFGEVDGEKIMTILTPIADELARIALYQDIYDSLPEPPGIGPQNPDLPISTGGVGFYEPGDIIDLSGMPGSDYIDTTTRNSQFPGGVPGGGKYEPKYNDFGYFGINFDKYRYGYMGGGRIKGYKYGGRPDGAMRRALVGEYGPEEVRFVPGSGFLVKPLTDGGRGNNTIVENLSVNVTGVPSDPTSARKAAVEIRKALTRLDREGTAGGGLTRR